MVENITKLDAARRQLKKAIWLFFNERDLIAIHTLAAASHEILHDLAKRKGAEDIKNNLHIREEEKRGWIKILSAAENFFKHANRDPEGTLEFCPRLTEFFLLDALRLYQQLNKSLFSEGVIYFFWFARKYPELLVEGALKTALSTAQGFNFNPDEFEFMRMALSTFRRLEESVC